MAILMAAPCVLTACGLFDFEDPNEPDDPDITDPDPDAGTEEAEPSVTGGTLELSHESGAYGEEFSLTVSVSEKGNKVYYTLDGSDPTTASSRYRGSIAIYDDGAERDYALTNGVVYSSAYGNYTYGTGNSCTVLKLLETDADGNEVARKTATYFIREGGERYFTIPVISLSLPQEDALSFYNDIENESKERAGLEYFDFSSGERFALNTQVKIGGNWTKGYPYRTVNLNFNKDENGKKNEPVTVDLFQGRTARNGEELTNFKRFRLHSGGNAQVTSWFADAFAQRVAAEVGTSNGEYITSATTGYRPCEVYLNGEYWGVYAIREHYSDVYFEQNYGVDKDDVILLDRNYNIRSGDETYADTSVYNVDYAFEVAEDDETGSGMELANELFYFLMNMDFTKAENYQRFTEMVDVDSLIDMVLVHLYAGNWDFMNNNIKMWRTATVDPSNPYADGKWRFCLHDLDFAFENQWGDVGINGANGYLLVDNDNIFNWNVPREYYSYGLDNIVYRPGKNYLDFYLGYAYSGIGASPAGWLSRAISCLLSSPMMNDSFRERFWERAAVVKEVYNSDLAKNILSSMKREIETPMRRHFSRWQRSGYTYSDWSAWVNNIEEVLSVRTYMRDYLNYFDGSLMYINGDYFERQIEAAIWRFDRSMS